MGLHISFLHQIVSSTKQQIDLSDELKLVNIWGLFAVLYYTQGIEQVLDHLISSIQQWKCILGLWKVGVELYLVNSAYQNPP